MTLSRAPAARTPLHVALLVEDETPCQCGGGSHAHDTLRVGTHSGDALQTVRTHVESPPRAAQRQRGTDVREQRADAVDEKEGQLGPSIRVDAVEGLHKREQLGRVRRQRGLRETHPQDVEGEEEKRGRGTPLFPQLVENRQHFGVVERRGVRQQTGQESVHGGRLARVPAVLHDIKNTILPRPREAGLEELDNEQRWRSTHLNDAVRDEKKHMRNDARLRGNGKESDDVIPHLQVLSHVGVLKTGER